MFKSLPKGLKIIFWIVLGNGIVMWLFLIASGLLSGFPLSRLTSLLWLFDAILSLCIIPTSLLFGIITSITEKGRRKELWLFSFIPFILSLIMFISGYYQPPVYWFLKDWQFERHFEQYNQIVKQIQVGNQDYRIGVPVPKSIPAQRVDGGKGDEGIVVVKFWLSGSNPRASGGYLYLSNDSWNSKLGLTRFYEHRKIKPYWYAYTDMNDSPDPSEIPDP
jgi:hypothetical protein